eukprot:362386-Chlamydomonas_euryale.AAC.3
MHAAGVRVKVTRSRPTKCVQCLAYCFLESSYTLTVLSLQRWVPCRCLFAGVTTVATLQSHFGSAGMRAQASSPHHLPGVCRERKLCPAAGMCFFKQLLASEPFARCAAWYVYCVGFCPARTCSVACCLSLVCGALVSGTCVPGHVSSVVASLALTVGWPLLKSYRDANWSGRGFREARARLLAYQGWPVRIWHHPR